MKRRVLDDTRASLPCSHRFDDDSTTTTRDSLDPPRDPVPYINTSFVPRIYSSKLPDYEVSQIHGS